MSIESSRKIPAGELDVQIDQERPEDINTVSIVFTDGDVQNFSLVVRGADSEWVYAQRCVDVSAEFVEEKVVSIRASAIRQIESDRIHLFDEGALHYGETYLVDPAAILEESWFDSDEYIL